MAAGSDVLTFMADGSDVLTPADVALVSVGMMDLSAFVVEQVFACDLDARASLDFF